MVLIWERGFGKRRFSFLMMEDIMKEKYAALLLEKCLDLKNSTYLYISYPKEVEEFAYFMKEFAEKRGIKVKLGLEDASLIVDTLLKTSLEDIAFNPLFQRTEWNEVAKDGGAILFIETVTEDYFSKVPKDKFEELMRTRRNTKPIYDEKLDTKELSWCIAAYPCEHWAKKLFPNDNDAYQKLLELLYHVCMIDLESPILAWEEELERSRKRALYLNSLSIKQLHYQNGLGTNFTVELPEHYQFCSAGEKNAYGIDTIVNMPSYEVFTSPNYRTTEGVIYSSKPLFYQGRKIDEFSLTFSNGKVVDMTAKEGYEILKGIVEGEESSSYLGEVALVDFHSPISDTGKVFETTLLDENASCHIALGCGFSEAIIDGKNMTEEERYKKGINKSKTHVDFMIGTSDLMIEAITTKGEKILIFKDGDFYFPSK